jgi:L-2-hydroxycarboxylate dehydrogenase (NAD+)
MPLVPFRECEATARSVLEAAGVPAQNARLQAEILLEAELRGVPSHGLLRLERIVHRIRNGVADPKTTGIYTWMSDGFLQVDGENGLGPVVAHHALTALCDRVGRTGAAVAAIANSNHIGMLSWYAEAVAEAGFVAIVLTTSEALVHPWGGRVAMIGTNPIAIGVPTPEGPFAIDLATSIVSMGEIHDKALRGETIPEGWALDGDGAPTTDPQAAKTGAISPFGGPKGYALGLAFELLVSALTGAALGRNVAGTLDTNRVCNKGDVIIVIDPRGADGQAISAYLRAVRQTPPAAGFDGVLIPGDRARSLRSTRMAEGLPLADSVWNSMMKLHDEAQAGVIVR